MSFLIQNSEHTFNQSIYQVIKDWLVKINMDDEQRDEFIQPILR